MAIPSKQANEVMAASTKGNEIPWLIGVTDTMAHAMMDSQYTATIPSTQPTHTAAIVVPLKYRSTAGLR